MNRLHDCKKKTASLEQESKKERFDVLLVFFSHGFGFVSYNRHKLLSFYFHDGFCDTLEWILRINL